MSSPSIYYNDPGGWWITTPPGGDYGAWRMPADKPVLIVDPITDVLYCLWGGNDDYTDTSAAGYINGEFYGAYSIDNGITWAAYVNLTNTRSPGAPAGSCYDEDCMTANPFVVNDSIYTTYIEDKDAGMAGGNEGVFTDNPVRCWIFHKNLITGIEEEEVKSIKSSNFGATIFNGPLLLPDGKKCKVYDVTGRTVVPDKIKPGVYFIEVDGVVIRKVIKIR